MKPSINPNPNPNANRKVYNYGKIEGAECTPLYPANKGKRDVNLKNTDIEGSWADSHSNIFMRKQERKDYRKTTTNDDIEGT